MTELDWKNKLHDALVNADGDTKIALYNIVYNEGPIDRYISALDYVQVKYVDTSLQLEELNRLYSNAVPYYGDYIILDCGHGDQVGSLDDLIEPNNYRTITDYLIKDPLRFYGVLFFEDETFKELVSDYIDWKYADE